MARDSPLQPEEQRLPGWRQVIKRQLRLNGQLLVPLIPGNRRLPERARRSGVDRNRHSQLGGLVEDRIEIPLVDPDQIAGEVAESDPQAPGNLQSGGAQLVRLHDARRHPVAIASPPGWLVPIELREDDDSSRVFCRRLELLLETSARNTT